jgi:hypothetical protein
MASSVLCEGEAYQIASWSIANRVAFQRCDFVSISGSEERQDAADLRGKEPKFLDVVTNAGENQHRDSNCSKVLLVWQRTIASQEDIEARLGSGTKQDTVAQPVPPPTADGRNIVICKFGC